MDIVRWLLEERNVMLRFEGPYEDSVSRVHGSVVTVLFRVVIVGIGLQLQPHTA